MNKAIKIQTKDLVTEYEMLKDKMNSMGEKALGLVFETSDEIKKIVIRGYTPSFNDGEPCVHCQQDNFAINSFFTEGYDFDSEDETTENCPVTPAELDLVKQLICSDMVCNYLQSKFETNFTVTITKDKSGKLKYESEYYSCD